jgi:hypothetical protein
VYGEDVRIGAPHALRERRGGPVAKVEVLAKAPRGGKWKVRHAEGDTAGLEEWVPSRMLLCTWSDLQALLEDERRSDAIAEDEHGDRVMCEAIDLVLRDASGEGSERGLLNSGCECIMSRSATERLWARAGRDGRPEKAHHPAFIDRENNVHLPFRVAYDLARDFCSTEPHTVLRYIEGEEAKFVSRGWQPGERWWHEELRKQMPVYALARSWAGHYNEIGLLQAEIERLHHLLAEATSALERAGATRDANRLRAAIVGQ